MPLQAFITAAWVWWNEHGDMRVCLSLVSYYAHAFSSNFPTQVLDILGQGLSFHSHYHCPPPFSFCCFISKNKSKQNPHLRCLLICVFLVLSFTVIFHCWEHLFWWESLSFQHPLVECFKEVCCLCLDHQSAFCFFSELVFGLLQGPLDRGTICPGRRHL